MTGLLSRPPGRPSAATAAQCKAQLAAFAARIQELRSRLSFAPSSRGWCYVLENERVITKGEFDAAQRLINDCRKDGTLPLDICSEDGRRKTEGVEFLSDDIEPEIEWQIERLRHLPSL